MITVIRPTWSAETDEQRKALERAVKLARQRAQIDAAMWEAMKDARDLDVPDTVICDKTGQSRATFNRKFGSRSSAGGAA